MEAGNALNSYRERARVDVLKAALDTIEASALTVAAPAGAMLTVLPRVQIVTAHARATIAAADPFMMSLARVTALETRLSSIDTHLAAAAAGDDHSSQIDAELDSVLEDLAVLLPASGVPGGELGVIEVDAMRAVFLRAQDELAKREAAISERIDAMTEQVPVLATKQVELQTLIDQANAEVATYKSTGSAEVEQVRTANSVALAEFRVAFDDTIAKAVEAGNSQMRSLLDAATSEQASHAQVARAELDVHNAAAAAALAEIQVKKDGVMKLASALGTGAQSAGWGAYADQQRKAADRLLMWAVVVFVGAAGVAMWLAIAAADKDSHMTWQRIVTKLALTAAFGFVGGYLATQSAEHRHQERLARRRHLDLLALPLFIATLDEDEKSVIVTKLAEEQFLTPEPPSHTPRVPRKGLSIDQFLEILATIKAAAK